MPALTRRAPRLLRQVAHDDWARAEDHQDRDTVLPGINGERKTVTVPQESTARKEDVDRDPESSDDEGADLDGTSGGFISADSRHNGSVSEAYSSTGSPFRLLKSTPNDTESKSTQSSKRSEPDSDDGQGIFGRAKKQKISYGKNIHAQSKPKARTRDSRKAAANRGSGFVVPSIPDTLRKQMHVPEPIFKKPPGSEIALVETDDLDPSFDSEPTYGQDPANEAPDGEPLSQDSALDAASEDVCALCGETVTSALRDAFDVEFQRGRPASYKWQRRFCRYHKQQYAQDEWRARGYPNIKWESLEKRMRKHDKTLANVLRDAVPSFHRERLRERLKSEETVAEEKSNGLLAGYYGPKGEKIMIEHIIYHLSDRIREQAAKDELVAASGVRGGVSGFVQAVLLPHLVELLVKDDLKLKEDWENRARGIISESAELGELVHFEPDERSAATSNDNDYDDDDDEGEHDDV